MDSPKPGGARRGARGSMWTASVGTRFKEQLGALMGTIQAVRCHAHMYIISGLPVVLDRCR